MSVSLNLSSTAWWKAALVRAVRTALVVAVPYVGSAAVTHVAWLSGASAAGLGFILSLLTSLTGLAETSGSSVPVWYSLLERTVKTVAQGIIAGIGNAVLFQDVHWVLILQNAAIAGVGSLLLGVIAKLPATVPVTVTPKPVIAVKPAAPAVPAAASK